MKSKKAQAEIRLDLGCGKNKRKDGQWIGVDSIAFEGVDVVADLTKKWQWKDNSISEVHASHFVEHLEAWERVHFCNELYRVLKPDGKATIITPHWASCRAYGDMTHQWPPVSEFFFYYLSREWRLGNEEKGLGANAPHDDVKYNPKGYNCNFECTWGYSLRADVVSRNQEWQQFGLANYKEVAQDIISTWVKK